jgi:hypothetical protein
VVFDVVRSGSTLNVYASAGGPYVNLVTLVGDSVLGGAEFDVGAFGDPGIAESTTTTFNNFYITGTAGSTLTDLAGGPASNPTMLPATPVGSLSGDIGGLNEPTSGFYLFYWKGREFEASVGVPEAEGLLNPPSYSFEICAGIACVSPLSTTIADSGNSWSSSLSGDLIAGFYTIGITDLGPFTDPQYTITFDTPINQIAGTPELTTWTMMLLGFAGLGFAYHRVSSKSAASAVE